MKKAYIIPALDTIGMCEEQPLLAGSGTITDILMNIDGDVDPTDIGNSPDFDILTTGNDDLTGLVLGL